MRASVLRDTIRPGRSRRRSYSNAVDQVPYTKVDLPNAPVANPEARQNARTQSITDMAFVDSRRSALTRGEGSSGIRAARRLQSPRVARLSFGGQVSLAALSAGAMDV